MNVYILKKSCIVFLLVFSSLVSIQTFASDYEVRKLGSFNKLVVEDGISVQLIHSDKNKATIHVDGIDLSDVVTEGTGFSLVVQLKKYSPTATVSIELEYTDELDEITTESSVYITSIGKLYADDLILDARFGGNITLDIEAKEIEIQASSATITIKGSVRALDIHALKNAYIDCLNLTFSSKDITASGGAVVKVKE